MASAINLNYGISDPETCRVEVVPTSCTRGARTTVHGSQVYTNPSGVVYRTGGMIVQDSNRGLRLPQQRSFLSPEYYNSGCTSLYCKDAQMCPGSVSAQTCDRTSDMMSFLFETQSDHTGNNAPPSCFGGGKCSGYDSTLGWQLSNKPGALQWETSQ